MSIWASRRLILFNKYAMLIWWLAGWTLGILADETGVSITAVERWSNLFGGQEARLHFVVSSQPALRGRVGWQCSVSGRKIAGGEIPLLAGSTGMLEQVEVQVPIPEVKAGVILPALLSVSVFSEAAGPALTNVEKTLWIFSDDPFVNRQTWLKELRIHLFDPEHKTAELFTKARIPFEEAYNPDTLSEIKDGILLLGEGISFNDYRGLAAQLFQAAAAGVPVLCLTPAEGDLPLPEPESSTLPRPDRITLQQADIIKQLDKRLDVQAWPNNGQVVSRSLVLRGAQGRVVGELRKTADGWPWLEVRYGPRGRLVVCGFGIVDQWAAGPTPRFLLEKLLEYVNGSKTND